MDFQNDIENLDLFVTFSDEEKLNFINEVQGNGASWYHIYFLIENLFPAGGDIEGFEPVSLPLIFYFNYARTKEIQEFGDFVISFNQGIVAAKKPSKDTSKLIVSNEEFIEKWIIVSPDRENYLPRNHLAPIRSIDPDFLQYLVDNKIEMINIPNWIAENILFFSQAVQLFFYGEERTNEKINYYLDCFGALVQKNYTPGNPLGSRGNPFGNFTPGWFYSYLFICLFLPLPMSSVISCPFPHLENGSRDMKLAWDIRRDSPGIRETTLTIWNSYQPPEVREEEEFRNFGEDEEDWVPQGGDEEEILARIINETMDFEKPIKESELSDTLQDLKRNKIYKSLADSYDEMMSEEITGDYYQCTGEVTHYYNADTYAAYCKRTGESCDRCPYDRSLMNPTLYTLSK